MNVIVNTSTLAQNQSELKKEQNYYQNKKSTFTSTSFGATGQLSSFLNKVNMTYNMIAKNIENISEYLEDYIKDVEGLENKMSNGTGNIKASTVSSVVNKYRNSIDKYNLNSETLFDVRTYKMDSHRNQIEKSKNNAKSALASAGISALSFLEGIGNIGEALGDGVGVMASNVCTLFGNDEKANEIMENVKKESSDEWYHETVEKLGLDKYADPDSPLSKISKGLGNLASVVAIGVATAGLGDVVAGIGAGGVVAPTVVTVAGGAVTGALMDAGTEGETAMKAGATTKEALQSANIHAITGAVFGGITGKLTSLAKGSKNYGEVAKHTISTLLIAPGEPLINEIARTLTYKNDSNKTFLENFVSNAQSDGLLTQMGFASISKGAVTLLSGLSNVKAYNKSENTVESKIKLEDTLTGTLELGVTLNERQIKLKKNEFNELLSDNDIRNLYDNSISSNSSKIPEALKEKYERLLVLKNELDTGQGIITDIEIQRLNNELIDDVVLASTGQILPIRQLNDIEIQVKKNEYFKLLANDYQLRQYLDGESNMLLDNELAHKVVQARALQTEIEQRVGSISQLEESMVNKILQNQDAGMQLRKELLASVDGIDNSMEKARKIYLELNKKLHYSMDFVKGDDFTKQKIFYDAMSFENLSENKTVICKGWSELYREALLDAGFSPDKVVIREAGDGISHRWIEISFDDKIVIADATDAIKGTIDLANVKAGMETKGFVILDNQYVGARLNKIYKTGQIDEALIQNYQKIIYDMDKKLGYVSEDGYFIESMNKAKQLFGGNNVSQELFGNSTQTMAEIMKMDIPKDMDGYEAFVYFKQINSNLLGQDSIADIGLRYETLYNKTETMVEPIFHMTYKDQGTNVHFLYSESMGKVKLETELEYLKYIENLNQR